MTIQAIHVDETSNTLYLGGKHGDALLMGSYDLEVSHRLNWFNLFSAAVQNDVYQIISRKNQVNILVKSTNTDYKYMILALVDPFTGNILTSWQFSSTLDYDYFPGYRIIIDKSLNTYLIDSSDDTDIVKFSPYFGSFQQRFYDNLQAGGISLQSSPILYEDTKDQIFIARSWTHKKLFGYMRFNRATNQITKVVREQSGSLSATTYRRCAGINKMKNGQIRLFVTSTNMITQENGIGYYKIEDSIAQSGFVETIIDEYICFKLFTDQTLQGQQPFQDLITYTAISTSSQDEVEIVYVSEDTYYSKNFTHKIPLNQKISKSIIPQLSDEELDFLNQMAELMKWTLSSILGPSMVINLAMTLIINTFAIDEFEYAIKFNLLLQLNKQHCQFNTQKFIYDDLMEFDEDNDLMVSNWHCASLCHDQRNQTGSKPYTSNSNNNRMNQIYKNQKVSMSQQKNLNFMPKKNSPVDLNISVDPLQNDNCSYWFDQPNNDIQLKTKSQTNGNNNFKNFRLNSQF
eukprot:403356892